MENISRRGLMAGAAALAAAGSARAETMALQAARAGFKTSLTRAESSHMAVDHPPSRIFGLVTYDGPAGSLPAYVTPRPKSAGRKPAIIWITGGDCNSIGDVWSPAPRSNDQSARAFRESGMVMMFPSLRGGNMDKGPREGFFGELDDIVAAAKYLAALDYVDPSRIYLGGHSTGGTMALLAAEYCNLFRATFSFGPVDLVSRYGAPYSPPIDLNDSKEVGLRSPILWLSSVSKPVFIFEGDHNSNAVCVLAMRAKNANPLVKTYIVPGATHFSVLAPVTELIAKKIGADTGGETNLAFTDDELAHLLG
jgi:dienelactone hydrolase